MSEETNNGKNLESEEQRLESLSIIQAKVEHLELIVPLFLQYREFYHQISSYSKCMEYLRTRLSKHEAIIFLCLIGEVPIGFALIYPSYNSLSLQSLYILHDFFINPTYRGKGYSTSLLNHLQNYSIQNNCYEIMLQTAHDNNLAQHIYEKNGFIRDTNFYCYYKTLLPAQDERQEQNDEHSDEHSNEG